MKIQEFINKVLSKLEYLFSIRWYNVLVSIYFNFRCLPLTQAIHLPIAIYGWPKIYSLRGKITFDCAVKFRLVQINNTHPAAPSFQNLNSEILINGKIIFHGSGQIDTGTKIYVKCGATLELGDHFKICDMVNIGCYGYIKIGKDSWITHRCQVFDTNYHFVADINNSIIPSTIKPVIIGQQVWVGNSTTIMGGTYIPDFTIIGSNSLVNKKLAIPEFSIAGGIPCKLIKTGFRKIYNIPFTMELYEYYNNNKKIYSYVNELPEDIFLKEFQ